MDIVETRPGDLEEDDALQIHLSDSYRGIGVDLVLRSDGTVEWVKYSRPAWTSW